MTGVARVFTRVDDVTIGGEDMVRKNMEDGAEDVQVALEKVLGLSVVSLSMPAEVSVVVLFQRVSSEGIYAELDHVGAILSDRAVLT